MFFIFEGLSLAKFLSSFYKEKIVSKIDFFFLVIIGFFLNLEKIIIMTKQKDTRINREFQKKISQ